MNDHLVTQSFIQLPLKLEKPPNWMQIRFLLDTYMYLMPELREVVGDKLYIEKIFGGNGNLQREYHGDGFGAVMSSVGCMAEKGR